MYILIVQISPRVQQTVQFTPLVLEHIFYSLIFSGQNSAFEHSAAVTANPYNLAFFIPPGNHSSMQDELPYVNNNCNPETFISLQYHLKHLRLHLGFCCMQFFFMEIVSMGGLIWNGNHQYPQMGCNWLKWQLQLA